MTERTVIATIEVTKIHKDIPDDAILEKEEVIENVKEEVKKALDADDVVVTNLQEFVRKVAVDEMQKEYNNGWIPCSERLPENNRPVLCWVTSTTIASGSTYIIGSCSNKCWFLQTYEIGHHHFPVKDYEVIGWQPLPEPYKEGGVKDV